MQHLIELIAMRGIQIIEFRSVLDVFHLQLGSLLGLNQDATLRMNGLNEFTEVPEMLKVEISVEQFQLQVSILGIWIGDGNRLVSLCATYSNPFCVKLIERITWRLCFFRYSRT